MKRKIISFFLALYLFMSTIGVKDIAADTKSIEVKNIEKPKSKQTQYIEQINKQTEPIIIETQEEIKQNLLTLDEIALEVIGGKWGSGEERKQSLINAGYNYEEIAKRVNEIMNGDTYTVPNKNTYKLNFGYVCEDVFVYDEYGNIDGKLSKYQKILLTNKKINDMTLVHFQDQTFYLKNKDIKKLADSHLEIDISEQKVYMYIDGKLILEANVITGHPNKGTTHGTNIGATEVYAKSYNVSFSENKVSKYCITFNWDGEAFHDASWREEWEFQDKTRYLTNGSDGCSNMMEKDVQIIDEYSYIGMPVLTHK